MPRAKVSGEGCNYYPNQHMELPTGILSGGTEIEVIQGQRIKVGIRYVVSFSNADGIFWVYEDLLDYL